MIWDRGWERASGTPQRANRQEEGPWLDAAEPDYARRASAPANRVDLTARLRTSGKRALIRDFGFPEQDLAEAAAFTRQIRRQRIQDGWRVNGAVKRLGTNPKCSGLPQRVLPARGVCVPDDQFSTWLAPENALRHLALQLGSRGFMSGYPSRLRAAPLRRGKQQAADFHTRGCERSGGLRGACVPHCNRGWPDDGNRARPLGSGLHLGSQPVPRRNADGGPRTDLSQSADPLLIPACSYFTPLASGVGKTFWPEPYDIAAGRFVANSDRAHRPRLHYRLGERRQIWA